MGRTVTSDFEDVRKRHAWQYVFNIQYKRRYFDSTTGTMLFESSWTTVPAEEIDRYGRVVWKLDTTQRNVFKSSNLTITLLNKGGKWKPDSDRSVFAPDAASWRGYEPTKTKWRVLAGVMLDSGSSETVSAFVGYAKEPHMKGGKKDNFVEIRIEGSERLLRDANAEEVSTQVTDESMGTDSGSAFTTVQPGVGIVDNVKIGTSTAALAAILAQGSDYTVSGKDAAATGATVTLSSAHGDLQEGQEIFVSYKYWKQNQKIEDMVGDLCDVAGIGSGDRSIEAVVFAGQVRRTITRTLAEGTDYFKYEGLLLPENTTDNPFAVAETTVTPSIVANALQIVTAGAGSAYTINWPDFAAATDRPIITIRMKMASTASTGGVIQRAQVQVGVSASTTHQIMLKHTQATGLREIVCSGNVIQTFTDDTYYVITMIWKTDTTADFYVDGSFVGNFAEIGGSDNLLWTVTSGGDACTASLDYFRILKDFGDPDGTTLPVQGSVELSSEDLGADIKNLGILDTTHDTPGDSSMDYETASSDDDISYDAFVVDSPSQHMLSTVRRYIKPKLLYGTTTDGTDFSLVRQYVVNYTTTGARISLAKFTGLTVFTAISELAKLPGYEWGFKGDGTFFFRGRDAGTVADFTIDQGDGVIETLDIHRNVERVFNVVKAQNGDHEYIADATTELEIEPTSERRNGRRELTISSRFLLDGDADVVTGAAKTNFLALKEKPWTLKLKGKFDPRIELSDLLNLTHDRMQVSKGWYWGDASASWGDTDIHFRSRLAEVSHLKNWKVMGAGMDMDNLVMNYDLEAS